VKITALKRFCVGDERRKRFIVKVETDAGIHGLGEVGIPHWGGAIDQAMGHLSERLIGQDPLGCHALRSEPYL
jgi:galactonate dehydratase